MENTKLSYSIESIVINKIFAPIEQMLDLSQWFLKGWFYRCAKRHLLEEMG
jgi:hypothetical protein